MSKLEILLCEWCGLEIHRGSHGPSPRYCNAACRMKASRARRAAAAVCAELQAVGAPPGPVVHARPAPRACTDEQQVARAYLEAKSLADVFARLGVDARPALAWRCAHVAEALTAAVNETLGGD
jgi:hypothetical protein